jgi:hypothetical protein
MQIRTRAILLLFTRAVAAVTSHAHVLDRPFGKREDPIRPHIEIGIWLDALKSTRQRPIIQGWAIRRAAALCTRAT